MTASTAEAPVAEPTAAAADPELRTYRGRTLEELLPKIRAELGPDAIVVRQREGLMGGIGGFFQQRFVEIEARAGHPRVDLYDEPPTAEDFARQLAAAEEQAEPLVSAAPFADALPSGPAFGDAPPAAEPEPPAPERFAPPLPAATAPVPPVVELPPFDFSLAAADFASALPVVERPEPEPRAAAEEALVASAASRRAKPTRRSPEPPAEHAELAATLVAHGVSERFARELVADAAAHLLPLMPDPDLRAATQDALARRIPVAPLPTSSGRVVAFAGAPGAGKTRCTAALAAAHAQAASQPVRCLTLDPEDGGAELTRLLAPHGVEVEAVATPDAARAALTRAPHDALVVLDTPAVSPGDADGIARLAARLMQVGPVETRLALPATLSAAAAGEQLERLAPLRADAIALTHADATDHVGALVELACETPLPLAYVADGRALPGGLAPADPVRIAERLLR